MSSNKARIARYKQRMAAAGFRRLSVWLHPALIALLDQERTRSECYGRTLERLILGAAGRRPSEGGRK